ncbi:hypothetical protein SAY86_030264 [Trapa natans]|uniref:Uncharacterized protein n=1 Tax=Trapa natans TaxID=22666 RepID=A0AAN7LXN1_TRANT|nr:hypothetical protein SAY86_030264 [Trapa natans]
MAIFFESVKYELIDVDLMSLLKALDLSGNWERATLLFESVVCSDLGSEWLQLDREVIELMARVLERESQHTMALNLFDSIAIEEYSLDIRAYTTILYAYSQSRKYERAVKLFGRIRRWACPPHW